MSLPLRSIVIAAAIASLALLLYGTRLGQAPFSPDETALLQQAQTIAQTGRDLAGRTTPLFVHVGDERWLQPVPVYAAALMSVVAPPALAARWASALFGAASVGLFYLLVSRLHQGRLVPSAATALFALTPAVFAYARSGVDAIYALPFVIGWLIGLWDSVASGRLRPVLLGTFALGVGVFTQPAAPLTFGVLMLLGIGVLWMSGTRGWRPGAAIVTAFALPVSAVAVWYAMYPSTYPDTFGRWVIHQAHLRDPLDGLRALINWNTLGTRASIYWGSFDPSWLFLDGPAGPEPPLQGAAPFLFLTIALAGAGLAGLVRTGATPRMVTLVAGAALAPLAASTFGVPHAMGAFLPLVPFVALIGAESVGEWQRRRSLIARSLGWMVALLLVVEFALFYAAQLSR